MFRTIHFASFTAALVATSTAFAAAGPGTPPKLRHQVDLQGDAVVIGSTLAFDCAAGMPAAPTGTKVSCATATNVDDTAPDLYWRDNVANATIAPTQARSSATLALPAGAKVEYARLYWGGLKEGATADTQVTVDALGGVPKVVKADGSWSLFYGFDTHPTWHYYQASADVTSLVSQWSAPDFRVTDVEAIPMVNADAHLAFSAWTLVVFYQRTGDELRNLALFDGFTHIAPEFGLGQANVKLDGFLVPAGFSARMTAFTYEGDTVYSGDQLLFNGQYLTDALNPQTNFFNGSRSFLGAAVSGVSDVPKLSGKAGTMGGYDLDTVDVSAFVKAGDKSAALAAQSKEDKFLLGGFVTSITNKSPDYPDFTKTATDLDGGALLADDEVEYVLEATNSGNDASIQTVFEDVLDSRLDFVPTSLVVVENGSQILLTPGAGDDRGEYDAATRTIRVRLGSGADATKGGKIEIGKGFEIRFRVVVKASTGTIPNQGSVTGSGAAGGLQKTWLSDGDPLAPGSQSTDITVNECGTNADCPANKPFCDPTSNTCLPCSEDSHCTNPSFPACQPDGTCGQCSSTNTSKCPSNLPACVDGTCAACTPGPNAPECKNDPDGPVCLVLSDPTCGCDTDDDCGSATSGRICEGNKCVDGCRGMDGNGCPTSLECTSKTEAPGVCQPPAETPAPEPTPMSEDSADDGNCGCALPGQERSSGAPFALLAFVLAFLGRRRRQSRA